MDTTRNWLWLCLIRWIGIVIVTVIVCITIYNVTYLNKIKPEVVPQYVWPSLPGGMH